MTTRAAIVSVVTAALLAGTHASHAATRLHTVRVAQGLSFPLFATSPPGDTTRLFLVERRGVDNRGRIKILKKGSLLARPFLTTPILAGGNEQGLLGLAFAPDYATTGRFYINYTRSADGATVVERRIVSADPDSADPAGTAILTVPQPFENHNGGWMGFGPDGYLYVAMGDGGGGGDPGDRAQNLGSLLGKILRLDVSGATYVSPPSNPFRGSIPGLDEIWSSGLRNPWRPGFDRLTGDFIVADVGQETYEEINFAPSTSSGGENYGWPCYEGSALYTESETIPCGSCLAPGCPKVFPAHQYSHLEGRCSVTGGYVYRGCTIPDLQGTYFFADFCGGQIYSGRFSGGVLTNVVDRTAELAPEGGLSIRLIPSFGEDARGEIYICDAADGEVYRIVPETAVAEADMPVLRRATVTGDSLGSTTPGNALLPGVAAFADAGSRIRGIGYLKDAAIRECAGAPAGCFASRLRLWPFDVDLEACVDSQAGRLTRRFIFTNRSPTPQPLAYVDVIAPRLNGDEDGATTEAPAGPGQSATLVQYDSFRPTRHVRHWGSGSLGVAYGADVDSAAPLVARVAADVALAGRTSAGPAALGLALGFDFGPVPASAAETVTVYTAVQVHAPTAVAGDPPAARARVLDASPVPFHSELGLTLTLPRAERASLEVFDVRGRLVRRLLDRALPAGPHRLRWDGRTGGGSGAPAGIYFIRYAGTGAAEVRRVVRLK